MTGSVSGTVEAIDLLREEVEMDLYTQVTGLNRYLSLVYRVPIRLSMLLAALGFTEDQIRQIRDNHVEEITNSFIALLRTQMVHGPRDDRDYMVVCRRFGLDGKPPETLQAIGDKLGITRERVRQLEQRSIKWRRPAARREMLEEGLYDIANGLLGVAQPRQPVLPLSLVSKDIPTTSAERKTAPVLQTAPANVDTRQEYMRLMTRIVRVVPDGISSRMIAHILHGSEGPRVDKIVSAYELTEYGIFQSHGYNNVRRMVLDICATEPDFQGL